MLAATCSARALLPAALILALASPPAQAHDLPCSYLELSAEEEGVRGSLRVPVKDFASRLGLTKTFYLPDVLRRERAALDSFVSRGLRVDADGRPLRLEILALRPSPKGDGVVVRFESPWSKPPESLGVKCRPFPELQRHPVYVTYRGSGEAPQPPVILDALNAGVEFRVGIYRIRFDAFRAFLGHGVHHIVIGPDHIAFIVGLILLGGTFARLVQIVTAFTLAHSLTLAATCLGLLNPPARLVEPLIASSIVYIGVENLLHTPKRPDRRALIAFAFGFVHGFGFAGVLGQLGLPRAVLGTALLAFNSGVEVGQLAIVLVATLVLSRFRDAQLRMPVAGRMLTVRSVDLLSSGIILAGSYWFAQRVFWAD